MFITGQLPQDIDGNGVGLVDIEKQLRVVFSRIFAILKIGGFGLDDVVKLEVFVKGGCLVEVEVVAAWVA